MQGEPALPADFPHFSYANPDAPKGGNITYCVVGSFDNLNPFIIKSLRTTARGVIDTIFGNLVFESLMQRNPTRRFRSTDCLPNRSTSRRTAKSPNSTLNPKAKWSDGQPVTPEDVMFTYEVYTEKGRPPYSDRMKKIDKIEKTGEHGVRFTFNENADREFPLIVAMTPIVPKHAFSKETFDETTLKPVTGSGPYRIAQVVPGRANRFRAQSGLLGEGHSRPSAASTITTASRSNISSTPTRSSKLSRKACAQSRPRPIRSGGCAISISRRSRTARS